MSGAGAGAALGVEALARHFPALLTDYTRVFGASGELSKARHAPPAYAEDVGARLAETKERYDVVPGTPAGTGTVQAPKVESRPAQAPLPL